MFFGKFSKSRKPLDTFRITRSFNDIEITIKSDIQIEIDEADKILEIICEELQHANEETGYSIAKRVCIEVTEKFHFARVSGEPDGKKWIIILSHYPMMD